MDMQAIMNAISVASYNTRGDYHLTLGRLIQELEGANPDKKVIFSDGSGVGRECSYRGYYSDLAFDSSDEPPTVADLLRRAKKALGAPYQGYKGGDFIMREDTPLWQASYGSCGLAIVGCEQTYDTLILVTRDVAD